jgi:hypothetical protein
MPAGKALGVEKANLSQGRDAKSRNSLSWPGRRNDVPRVAYSRAARMHRRERKATVGEIHELQAEDPARSRRRVSPFVLVLGVLAAFCGALALSALFAHPAGASTLPVPGGTPPLATASNVAQPAVAALPTVVDSDVADLVPGAAATPVSSLLQVAPVPALTHLVEPIAQSLGSTIGLEPTIGLETPASAPAVVPGTVPQVVSTAAQSHAAPGTRLLRTTSDARGNLPALGLVPRFPAPISPPTPPIQRFPLASGSSPASDSSFSSSGSNALSVTPPSGQKLSAPMVSARTLEQSSLPQFLFDKRSSPPG